ncbi:MAG: HlyD family secretion protein [Anaerolineae bacterium]
MRKVVGIVLIVLAVAVAAVWYQYGDFGIVSRLSSWTGLGQEAEADAALTASGFIEARQVAVVPEFGGRIAALSVVEGDPVAEGQVLVQLDTALLDAQIAEAEAAVAVAEAQVARAQAGAKPADVAVAEQAVALAEAQRDAAHQNWQSALQVRDNPQEVDLRIAAAQAQIAVLEQRIVQAVAVKDAAELLNGLRERQVRTVEGGVDVPVSTPGGTVITHVDVDKETRQRAWAGWNLATTDVWTAWSNLQGIQAARDGAVNMLAQLNQLRANPQEAAVEVARAESAYHQAEAAVAVAESRLDVARAGAAEEQVALARAAVVQAERALDTLLVQRAKATITAPMAGFVVERHARIGEVAVAGRPLLTIGSLDVVELRAYVAEPDMAAVAVGQAVRVAVDSFPGTAFAGAVTWISDEAEFTPRNVQTREERAQTVYAVLIRIDNADQRLKPGMPADVVFAGQ